MKNLIKKLVRWVFQDRVRLYSNQQIISDVDVVQSLGDVVIYARERMAKDFGMALMRDNMIEFEQTKDVRTMNTIITAKIRIIR